MSVRIITGDAREQLALLPAASVNCVVTSPPYFGLRDYGAAGQIGLEPSPDEYVAALVAVFREVRRVLRNDGTLWLNLGDSYCAPSGGFKPDAPSNIAGSKQAKTHPHATQAIRKHIKYGCKHKDLIGIPWLVAFALRQPWTDWQIKTEAMRAWVAGIVDGEGCITILRTKSSHCESLSFPPIVQVRMCDREPLDRLVDVAGSKIGEPQMPPSHLAANQRESWQWKLVSDKAAKVIAEIYPFLTCKRKQAIVAWNHQAIRAARGNQERKRGDLEKEQFCKDLINDLNQRRAVDIPSWMVEPRIVQEPGWYLRQDLIWSKPNPMPESVTDRCTKAHEYMFLLSKSERYYYDADAVREQLADERNYPDWDARKSKGAGSGNRELSRWAPEKAGAGVGANPAGRNKRSVWEIATQPYPEAHFATFPPALIEPCILAGCPENGTVLDCFGGAGTVGMVADRLGRNAILVELNPAYAAMAQRRIEADAGMFAQIEVDMAQSLRNTHHATGLLQSAPVCGAIEPHAR